MGFSILAKGILKEGRKLILEQISRFTNYPGSQRDVRKPQGSHYKHGDESSQPAILEIYPAKHERRWNGGLMIHE